MAGFILIIIVMVMWASLVHTIALRKMAEKQRDSVLATAQEDQLHCTVDIISNNDQSPVPDMFAIKIRGRVFAPTDMHETDIEVIISDITDNIDDPQPVLCNVEKWQMHDSPAFCHTAYYGKMPHKRSTLTYWTTIIEPSVKTLTFPRVGLRKIQFTVTILSHENQATLACASTIITHNNTSPGYVDIDESSQLTETLVIQLALSVTQQDKDSFERSIHVVDSWITARSLLCDTEVSRDRTRNRLVNILTDAVTFAQTGQNLDTEAICTQLVNSVEITDRYTALELALHAVESSFESTREQIKKLNGICEMLQLDRERFRQMCQKILPMKVRRNEDMEFILGITADMDETATHKKLNDEYRRWNSRVNHPDPEIRSRADAMLELIARVKSNMKAGPALISS